MVAVSGFLAKLTIPSQIPQAWYQEMQDNQVRPNNVTRNTTLDPLLLKEGPHSPVRFFSVSLYKTKGTLNI